jgi:hypothetical protein
MQAIPPKRYNRGMRLKPTEKMMQAANGSEMKVSSFELKYCERCGGLWLRPIGGGQIYCAGCGRAISELPVSSYEGEVENEEDLWGLNGAQFELCELEEDELSDQAQDAGERGGVA